MNSLHRVQRELSALKNDFGYYIEINDSDISKFVVYIIGVEDSPYEYGLFRFDFELPTDYPMNPPKVTFKNFGSAPQIHPNVYNTGKVCLSILGTWSGEKWTPLMKISSVIMQIRALLGFDESWKCEPGHEHSSSVNKNNWITMIRYIILSENMNQYIPNEEVKSEYYNIVNEDKKNMLINKVKYTLKECHIKEGMLSTPPVGIVSPIHIKVSDIISMVGGEEPSNNKKRNYEDDDYFCISDQKNKKVCFIQAKEFSSMEEELIKYKNMQQNLLHDTCEHVNFDNFIDIMTASPSQALVLPRGKNVVSVFIV